VAYSFGWDNEYQDGDQTCVDHYDCDRWECTDGSGYDDCTYSDTVCTCENCGGGCDPTYECCDDYCNDY